MYFITKWKKSYLKMYFRFFKTKYRAVYSDTSTQLKVTLKNKRYINPEMPTTTECINQYFKLKMFMMLNRRILVKLIN